MEERVLEHLKFEIWILKDIVYVIVLLSNVNKFMIPLEYVMYCSPINANISQTTFINLILRSEYLSMVLKY